jgi:hypothetical protein
MFPVYGKVAWTLLEPTDGPAGHFERALMADARLSIVRRMTTGLHDRRMYHEWTRDASTDSRTRSNRSVRIHDQVDSVRTEIATLRTPSSLHYTPL